MRSVKSGLVVWLCIAVILALGAGSSSEVSAQARPRPGVYKVVDYFLNESLDKDTAGAMPRLQLLPTGHYVWGKYYAPFKMEAQATIILDCRAWGEVSQDGKIILRRTDRERDQRFRYVLEYERALEGPPTGSPKGCDYQKHTSAPAPSLLAAASQQEALRIGIQVQAPAKRTIDGELLLTIDRRGYTQEDLNLWSCLITRGYPKVEFFEGQGQPAEEEVFVWPDASFRTDLRGGVNYQWALTPRACMSPTRQLGGIVQRPGPELPPSTEEKVVLACFVKQGRFADCEMWWLVRPAAAPRPIQTKPYNDQACGYSFEYPADWVQIEPFERRARVRTPDGPATLVVVGPVWDEQASQVTTDQLARSLATQNCLECLRRTLVWVDRFVSGPLAVSYTISTDQITVDGRVVPYYYTQFFMVDDGTSRGLGTGGRTRAEVAALAPVERFQDAQPAIMAVARSLRFAQTQTPCFTPPQR